MKIWESKPSGTLWATPGLLGDSFTVLGMGSRHLLIQNPGEKF